MRERRRLQFFIFHFSFFILLLLAVPAFAQTQSTDESAAPELPPVTVSAQRLNESTDDPPAFVEVIEMSRFAGRVVTTEEVLREAVGVNVRQFGGIGSPAEISVRGSGPNQVVVLVDGVRLNPAAGGAVDLSTIPVTQIERIEVIRGGDSAIFGEGALGGVVNIITRKPDGRPHTSLAAMYGSFNTARFTASQSGGGPTWRYLAAGSFLHTDGTFTFRNDNGTSLDTRDDFPDTRWNNQLDSRSLLVRVGFTPNSWLDITAHNDFYSAQGGVPGLVTFPSLYANQSLLRDTASLNFALSGLGLAGLSLHTALRNRYDRSIFRDPHGEQTGVPINDDRRENEPEIEQGVQYVWGRHQIWTLTGGFRQTTLRDPAFDNPHRESWAAALRDQVLLWSDRLTLLGAIRYDHASDLGGQWSPKAGFSLKPLPWLAVKANIGQSFRAPDFSELYLNQGYLEGNPDLRPERALHFDAGPQITLPWLYLESAYFRSEVRDLIEYELIAGFRYKPFNVGRARLEGGEWSASITPVEFLTLSGAYTLTYAIDETQHANRQDRQIPGRPRHVAFGRLEGAADIFRPFVEYYYVSGNFITAANTKLLPDRRLWNAGLVIAPSADYRLSWEMKNVLDEQAVDVRGFPLPGRAVYLNFEAAW